METHLIGKRGGSEGTSSSSSSPPPWPTRLNIALTAARGIEYIHSRGAEFWHGNLKSSNVLVDLDFDCRVADHMLAQLHLPRPNGYSAPEVIADPRKISHWSDVYSFGILLLELLTGRPPTAATATATGQKPCNHDGGEEDLVELASSTSQERWSSHLIDQRLPCSGDAAAELTKLAVQCCALSPSDRPAMSQVAARIEEIKNTTLK